MSSTRPVATYAMRVPPGDILIPAVPEFAPMVSRKLRSKSIRRVANLNQFRITMAAIDPSEDISLDASEPNQKPRATLKIVRVPFDDSDMDDELESDSDEDSEDDGINGGPSKKAIKAALEEADDMNDSDSEDSEDEAEAQAVLAKLMDAAKKGKSKASDEEESDSDDEDMDESLGMDECVLCTLDPEKVCSHVASTLKKSPLTRRTGLPTTT